MSPELAIYPSRPPATPRTLVDILDATISAYPEALAIDNSKTQLNYTQLAYEVATKAEQLKAIGVGFGDRIGIRMSSGSIGLYLAILAVLTAGAAYVPVEYDTFCPCFHNNLGVSFY